MPLGGVGKAGGIVIRFLVGAVFHQRIGFIGVERRQLQVPQHVPVCIEHIDLGADAAQLELGVVGTARIVGVEIIAKNNDPLTRLQDMRGKYKLRLIGAV